MVWSKWKIYSTEYLPFHEDSVSFYAVQTPWKFFGLVPRITLDNSYSTHRIFEFTNEIEKMQANAGIYTLRKFSELFIFIFKKNF